MMQEDDDADTLPQIKPETQTKLTDPDSTILRKSVRPEYRQGYNAQAIADADGRDLILATNVLSTSNDRQELDDLLESCVVTALEKRKIEPLIAIGRQEG
jgi:hypothetical protein